MYIDGGRLQLNTSARSLKAAVSQDFGRGRALLDPRLHMQHHRFLNHPPANSINPGRTNQTGMLKK